MVSMVRLITDVLCSCVFSHWLRAVLRHVHGRQLEAAILAEPAAINGSHRPVIASRRRRNLLQGVKYNRVSGERPTIGVSCVQRWQTQPKCTAASFSKKRHERRPRKSRFKK